MMTGSTCPAARLSSLAVLVALAASPGAFAGGKQDKEQEAKKHFMTGKKLVEEGACEQAIVELKASYELNPVPIVLYNIAVAYDTLHKYASASSYYAGFLEKDASAPGNALRVEVEKRLDDLAGFLGSLELTVDVEGAEIIIDGELAGTTPAGPIDVETGEHDLLVRQTGYADVKKTFKVTAGKATTIQLSMTSLAPEEKSTEGGTDFKKKKKKIAPAWFYAFGALTAATGIAAIATGSLAVKKDRELEDMSRDDDWKPLRDEGRRLAVSADTLLGICMASLAATVVLAFFTDFRGEKKNESQTALPAPLLLPGGAGVGLAF